MVVCVSVVGVCVAACVCLFAWLGCVWLCVVGVWLFVWLGCVLGCVCGCGVCGIVCGCVWGWDVCG